MIKAMFFDVDGTLVSFRTHRATAAMADALQQLHRRGVKLFISTGGTPGCCSISGTCSPSTAG